MPNGLCNPWARWWGGRQWLNSCFRCFRFRFRCFRSDPLRATHPAAATHPRPACGLPPPGSHDPPIRQVRPTRKLLVTHPATYKKFLRLRRAIKNSSSPAAGSYRKIFAYGNPQAACDQPAIYSKIIRLRRAIKNSSSPAAGSCRKYSPAASYATHPARATSLLSAFAGCMVLSNTKIL